MNLFDFIADTQRFALEQRKREHDLNVVQALAESVSKPVPFEQRRECVCGCLVWPGEHASCGYERDDN